MSKVKIYFNFKGPLTGILTVIILAFILFSFFGGNFFSFDVFTSILTIAAETGFLAIGECILIISGNFDLSVGATYILGGFVYVLAAKSLPSFLAFIIALGLCAFVGYINGVITIRGKIPSFIVTLGMMMIVRGALLLIVGGRSINYEGDSFIPTILSNQIKYGIRPSHFWFIILILLLSFILTRTPYGNWTFATGGDKKSAREMGVNVNKVQIKNFIIMGVLAGIAGCMAVSRFRFANVAFGNLMELEAIAGAVIGGTLMSGGVGSIIGTGLGSFLLAMIRIGIVLLGAPGYSYKLLVGLILIIAGYVNILRTNKYIKQ